jgi:hypothetical protein
VVFKEGDKAITKLFLDPNKSIPSVFAAKSLACVANDPGGVESVTLSFTQTIDICVFSGGCGTLTTYCPYGGGIEYHLSPSMPAAQTATSHPDSSGRGLLHGKQVCLWRSDREYQGHRHLLRQHLMSIRRLGM